MEKIFKATKVYLFLLLVAIPSIYSLIKPGYFPMHDDIQAFRLLELDKCIQDGQMPCRWIPDMGYGYGYPQFNYYGPLPYYIMEIAHLTGFGFLDSTKIGFILSILLSGLGMYLLGKSLWGKTAGIVSSVFYIYGPYRAVNVYVRGAMGEAWGMAFLPLIFWSTKEVIEKKKYSQLWLALSIAGLFVSHNVTALIFIPFYAAWVIYLLATDKKRSEHFWPNVKKLLFSAFWSFLMAAFFILPAYFEKKYAHVETITMGYFNYLAHYVGLKQFLFTAKWDYGNSELGPNDGIFLSTGILHWLFPLVTVFLLFLFKKRKEIRYALLFVALGWISVFMVHPRSVVIWDMIPILTFVQFPWRFLTIATFCFSIAAGAITTILPKKNLIKALVTGAIILLVVITCSRYFKPSKVLYITDADKFSGDAWQKQLTISIFDYLPIYAKMPPTSKAPDSPTIAEGEGSVVSGQKGTDWQKWTIDVKTDSAKVLFPLYDFPRWEALVNGNKTSITHNNELGLITLSLNKGTNSVDLKLHDTPIRTVSNLFTLFSLLMIPAYLIINKKRK